jgi:broad specificity phosphatase PhoE/predicted kinase
MVGLPARGKTYIARKLARYLSWLGYQTRVFNVGAYRREKLGAQRTHEFFDPSNMEAESARRSVARVAMEDMLKWFRDGGEVAIYDATNHTRDRRAMVRRGCEMAGVPVLFVESICNDATIIASTVREIKLNSPDYVGVDPDEAVQDFSARIAHYEQRYETLDASDGSFVKLINVGHELVLHDLRGDLPGRLVRELMNLHIVPRPVWLTRHGESAYNVDKRVGGDADLTPRGERFAVRLTEFFNEHVIPGDDVQVWTSTLRRATQTARYLPASLVTWRALDEIDAGIFDGMTYEEIKAKHPEEYARRQRDKLRYRYPRGESYEDVIQRLEPIIIELERQRSPTLVVTHRAVLRCLYAYFLDQPPSSCTRLDVPLHTVIELTPNAYGCDEERIALGDPVPEEV